MGKAADEGAGTSNPVLKDEETKEAVEVGVEEGGTSTSRPSTVKKGDSYKLDPDNEFLGRPSEGVTLSDFDRIKVLGKGSFGKVLLVEKSGSNVNNRFAMKVLKKSKLRRAKQVERTKTERRVLEICDGHPFIMSMFYAFQVYIYIYIQLFKYKHVLYMCVNICVFTTFTNLCFYVSVYEHQCAPQTDG